MFWFIEKFLLPLLGIVRQTTLKVDDAGLKEIRIYVVKKLWASGFSAGPVILIKQDAAEITHAPRWQKEMYLEEYWHSMQYLRENPDKFPVKYLLESIVMTLQGKDHYNDNKYEIEAKKWAKECYDGQHVDPYYFDVVAWGQGHGKGGE